MKSTKVGLAIVGVLLLLAGITFALQGANYLGGSAMTGSSFWLYAGVGIAIVGLVLLVGAVAMKSGGKMTSTGGIPSTP
ncbi:MAG TPA: hypothetical protein VFE91_07780 [Nitrososphaerales archaeon]|nr:hypothetical protein [Nitrososphaerales archaeon]